MEAYSKCKNCHQSFKQFGRFRIFDMRDLVHGRDSANRKFSILQTARTIQDSDMCGHIGTRMKNAVFKMDLLCGLSKSNCPWKSRSEVAKRGKWEFEEIRLPKKIHPESLQKNKFPSLRFNVLSNPESSEGWKSNPQRERPLL